MSSDTVLPRYLRKVVKDGSSEELEDHLSRIAILQEVKWLPNFVALPGYWILSDLEKHFGISYRDLNLYPMDISSALPVLALNVNKNEPSKILDLCCCPGGKLQYLHEVAGNGSFVLGVDIANQRLKVCRSLLHRYQSRMELIDRRKKRLLLFNCDGVSFNAANFGELLYDSEIILNLPNNDKFKLNKSTRKRYEKELDIVQRQLRRTGIDNDTRSSPIQDLDYVLVDAECTHDASYRHLRYLKGRSKWGKRKRAEDEVDFWDEEVDLDALQNDVEDDEKEDEAAYKVIALSHGIPLPSSDMVDATEEGQDAASSADVLGRQKLQTLQRNLLLNGFRLLRPGGVLVYSTCSSDFAQNEDIVQWLLDTETCAVLEPALPHFMLSATSPTAESSSQDHVCELFLAAQQAMESDETADAIASKRAVSEQVCNFFASLEKPLLKNGSLPGTIRVDAHSGMSGHFIARIRKQ